jgi:hypothetical protein
MARKSTPIQRQFVMFILIFIRPRQMFRIGRESYCCAVSKAVMGIGIEARENWGSISYLPAAKSPVART